MLDQHDRQRVKTLLCQLFGGAGKDALLRVGQLFADPHLRITQSLLTQLFADVLRSLVAAGQHKHPRMAAHLRHDLLLPAVDAEKLDVVPAGLQLGAEILQRADARQLLEPVVREAAFEQTCQLFGAAVKAGVTGKQHADGAALWLLCDIFGNLLIAEGGKLPGSGVVHRLQHPFGANQAVAARDDLLCAHRQCVRVAHTNANQIDLPHLYHRSFRSCRLADDTLVDQPCNVLCVVGNQDVRSCAEDADCHLADDAVAVDQVHLRCRFDHRIFSADAVSC